MSAIEVRDLYFGYKNTEGSHLLKGINFKIEPGEFVAIQGPSGSGKSTLLYLLGCLLKPTKGDIKIQGHNINLYDDERLALLRNECLGFVFQQFHLLPQATVYKNITLPLQYSSQSLAKESVDQRVNDLVKTLGLTERMEFLPNQLSGGQQQRVAIARALINDPEIILADEPTGNLDSKNARATMDLFRKLNRELGKTIIIITHDNEVAEQCDRSIHIRDGELVSDDRRIEFTPAKQQAPTQPPQIKALTWLETFKDMKAHMRQALVNLGRQKMRTALNMLGIAVGVAAVLSMLTLGNFIKEKVISSYSVLGVNTVLFHGRTNWMRKATDVVNVPFTSFNWDRDLAPLKTIFPQINRLSPLMNSWRANIFFAGRSIENEAGIVGVGQDFLEIAQRKLILGRNFVYDDVERMNAVCLIGYEVYQRLFSNVYPIGQVLRVLNGEISYGCRIIGVVESISSSEGRNKPNLSVFLPFKYYQTQGGDWWSTQIDEVLLEIKTGEDIQKVGAGIQSFFEKKYGASGRFRVDANSILLAQMQRFLGLFTILLALIALVTLSVGGVGITNMMLVSVNERLREIGLRKAIGATHASVRLQFLSESLVICFIAGLAGLLMGFITYNLAIFAATKFIDKMQFEWVINFFAIFISLVSIVLVGLISGIFPAIKAEKLQVIEALRSE